MQIGDVAKRTSLTADAIRFYEKRKLLPRGSQRRSVPIVRRGHHRAISFHPASAGVQGLGFSSREVGELIQLRERKVDSCESVKELLKAKLTDVRAKLQELRHLESTARNGFAKV